MEKRKLKKWMPAAFILVLVGGLASCSTENIDLNDIDTTLGWELKDFKLPGNNSTHAMVMQELFDIDTTGCIKINPVNGDYYFVKKGDPVEPSTTEVEAITVTTSTHDIYPNPFRISAEQLGIIFPTPPTSRAMSPGNTELSHTIQVFQVYQSDLAGDIVRLEQTTTNDAILTMTIHFSNDLNTVIDEIAGLSFYLPSYFTLGDVSVVQNGRLKHKDSNSIEFEAVSTSSDFVFNVIVNALDFTACQDTEAENYLVYRRLAQGDGYIGEVEMKGKIDVTASFDPSRLCTDLSVLRPDMEFVIDSELSIQPITISSATGEFRPSFDFQVEPASIGDVPDLLDAPDTNVKLHNLVLRFDVASTLGLTGIIEGDLITNFKDNSSQKVTLRNIEVLPETTSHIVICHQQPAAGEYPGCQVFYTGHPDVMGSVQDLVGAIPESVEFKSTATTKAGETGTIYLGHTYTFSPSYEMEALLALDRGSTVIYRDTINGWADDLEDIELSNGATVTIEADIVNECPLDFNLDITAINANHQSMNGEMDVTVTTAASGNIVPAQGQTHITVVVRQKTDGAFHKLDGIALKAVAHGNVEGVPLNSGEGKYVNIVPPTIHISNIGATLTGIVIVNNDNK